jgi:hypothetical protein
MMEFTIKATRVEVEKVELDITMTCDACGDKLEVEYEETSRYGILSRTLLVTPCKECLQKAEDKGREAAEFEAENK